jgi:predicted lysophospholipase L1 biosynthesis ABC-type transport system permease subunit
MAGLLGAGKERLGRNGWAGVNCRTAEGESHDRSAAGTPFPLKKATLALNTWLGARPGEIVALAMRETAVFVPAGIAVGVGLTFWMSKLVMKFLPGMKAPDLTTMVATGVALLVMAVAAGLSPALRVGRVHPSEALRNE